MSGASRLRKLVVGVLLSVGVAVLFGQARGYAQAVDQDPLKYARGFLVTGNYVAGGVDLNPTINPPVNGLGTGTIPMSGVPAGADIIGAFLYWESIYAPGAQPTAGARFRGSLLDAAVAWPAGVPGLNGTTFGRALPGNNTSSCWGSANVPGSQLTMFRADVLRLLPKLFDAAGTWTGKYLVNDADLASNVDLTGTVYAPHSVTLPESNGNHAVQSAGAALVVIYRNPAEPLTKVVLYDGVYAQVQGNALAQTLRAFYQHAGNTGRMTPLVGSGAPNNKTELFFNGSLVTLNPFPASGPSSHRSWNFPTFSSLAMGNLSNPPAVLNGPGLYDGYGETATMGVAHTNDSPYDCLAVGGIVFSTPVTDADNDGLPDALEASSTAIPNGKPWRNPDVDLMVTDPGKLLPDLHAMGASPGKQDVFVEIGAMTAPATTYGSSTAPYDSAAIPIVNSVLVPAHSHLPGPDVLKMLGDVYFNRGIAPHFDVGNTATYLGGIDCSSNPAPDPVCQYLVPSAVARGGETITERKCVPQDPNTPYATCRFFDYPGTVGWKFSFEAYRDAAIGDNGEEITNQQQLAAWNAAGSYTNPATNVTTTYHSQRNRFDRPRKQFFHYVMYGHAQGSPKSLPCLVNGVPADYDVNGTACTTNNPNFQPLDYHVPSSRSGVSDLPGNGALITLGLWDSVSGTGTSFVQASTTLHELGHNLELWHGGKPAIYGSKALGTVTYFEPNCKPNYFSSMNYLSQAHGLIDPFGNLHLDYSGKAENNIDENVLADGAFSPTPLYQPVWFAPANSALATLLGVSPATRMCNGVRFSELAAPPNPMMARVWAPVPNNPSPGVLDWSVAVDWLGDDPGNPADAGVISNVNFDGVFGGNQTFSDVLFGYDDWANIRLNQIGAARGIGRSVAGPEFLASSGECPGCDDVAADCPGCDDVAADCPGCGDVAADCPECGGSPREVDFTTAKNIGRTPPSSFTACILGAPVAQQGCDPAKPWTDNTGTVHASQPGPGDPNFHRVYMTWKIPSVDNATGYLVYRQRGSIVPVNWKATAVLVGTPSTTTLVDTAELPDSALNSGLSFVYFAQAVFTDKGTSGVSNFVLISKTVNDAPVAQADNYGTGKGSKLTVPAAQGVLANDTDDDSAHSHIVAVLVSGPSNTAKNGFTLNPDGSFTYMPKGGFTGTDTFTYMANDGLWKVDMPFVSVSANSSVVTVTINVQ